MCVASTSWLRDPVVVMTGVNRFSAEGCVQSSSRNWRPVRMWQRQRRIGPGIGIINPKENTSTCEYKSQVRVGWYWKCVMELLNGSTFVTGSYAWWQFGFDPKWTSTATGEHRRQEVPMEFVHIQKVSSQAGQMTRSVGTQMHKAPCTDRARLLGAKWGCQQMVFQQILAQLQWWTMHMAKSVMDPHSRDAASVG